MLDLSGKGAFISGGASGIGFAMAAALGRQGVNVMLGDVEKGALDRAISSLRSEGISADGVLTDVSVRASMENAAEATTKRFGKIHILCNNAGVVVGGALGSTSSRDWDWVIDVNVRGVINGMEIFTPLIEGHDEGGHIVNTASVNGMINTQGIEPYTATKFAIVGMSEGWAAQLEPKGIGLSILCPGMVDTRIIESRRNRSSRYGQDDGDAIADDVAGTALAGSISPIPVAERVIEAIRDNDLYVFTHVEYKLVLQARFDRIMAAFGKSERSPALSVLGSRKNLIDLIPL